MRKLLTDALRTLVPPKGDRHGPLPPLLLTLTLVTGLVGAVSYLSLGHVFVANMTGNVVFLGFALAGAPDLSALASVVALAAFLGGALAGGRLDTRFATHRGNLLKTATAVKTVLTLTLTGLAADSGPAGGAAPRSGRRILSVLAMLLGAFAGTELLLHGHLVSTLGLALLLLLVTSLATHRLADGAPAWTRSGAA
ncbi:DUF1275 family protein [Streptomyces sp. NPDC127079]|uniref:DUF1275 family protein n=1 Tax=Streptomyces sp. NPDC127079 TaxID=3347132 RepID=UPI00366442F5